MPCSQRIVTHAYRMNTASIAIKGLEKIYAGKRREAEIHALKPLWLDIAPGEVFGLLGPNGAGKTTLVKLLLGITYPSSGTASVAGRPIGSTASKEAIGYLPENHRYPLYLTGEGVLNYFGTLSGLSGASLQRRIEEILELVNMSQWRNMKVKKYSKGMMQRIGIAQAMLNDPTVIFLDEPTDGVDPVGRKEIRDLILHLRSQGTTIFLNSHLLSEVEMISDRVAILNKGELVRIGTVRELTQDSRLYRIDVAGNQGDALARLLAPYQPERRTDHSATIEAKSIEDLNAVIDMLRSQEVLITAITPVRQTLEELFIDIVQKGGAAQ